MYINLDEMARCRHNHRPILFSPTKDCKCPVCESIEATNKIANESVSLQKEIEQKTTVIENLEANLKALEEKYIKLDEYTQACIKERGVLNARVYMVANVAKKLLLENIDLQTIMTYSHSTNKQG